MIVKKVPIFQWFPDFTTVKSLTETASESGDFAPVFYDIETTGLSRNSTFLYLIGAVVFEHQQWYLYQWLGENPGDEKHLLKAFSDFLIPYSCTIQYNGNRFDQPYLEARCRLHQLPSPFEGKPSLDLYHSLKPLKALLKLPRMKQPDLEAFLGLRPREYCDGGECIRIYRSYQKSHDTIAAETVLGHNREDLEGLGRILSMLGYLCLFKKDYQVEDCSYQEGKLLMKLTLPFALPVPFSNGQDGFYITGHENTAGLSIRAHQGKIRQYYANYKDYDYLPGEDTAIPKSLSSYIDKSLRTPAKPETCYTWFDCTKAFLDNPGQQLQYLHHSLPFLLKTLK